MTDKEMLAIGAGLALGFMAIWFMTGSKKAPGAAAPAAAPGARETGVSLPAANVPEMAGSDTNWRSALGVGPDAGRAQIDAAYAHLCRQTDVNELEQMAPQLRAIAQTRRVQLDEAYRRGLAHMTAEGK